LIPLSVACLVAGVRLLLVARWGGDAPYMDECNQVGWLHIVAGQGKLSFHWLVYPFFEHRLVTQRLYTLALAWADGGQWDVRVELVANACLWGLFAGALTGFGGNALRGWTLTAWAVFVLLAEAIPFAWENLLWAFQVQFLFMVGFSILAFWFVPRSRPFSGPWWFGFSCGVAACASQSSGLLVWPALLVVIGCEIPAGRQRSGGSPGWGLAAISVAFALGLWANAYAEPQTVFHATDAGTWWRACLGLFSWPWRASAWAALGMWAPALAWLFVGRPFRRVPAHPWSLALLAWSVMQIASAAWARGGSLVHGLPPSRYSDALVLGTLANAWILLFWAQAGTATRPKGPKAAAAAVWLMAAMAGLCWYCSALWNSPAGGTQANGVSMSEFIASRRVQADALRTYVRTGNMATLSTAPPIYPIPKHLAEIVDRLRATGGWPASLSALENQRLPFLGRVAHSSGSWAWAVIGAGVAAAILSLRLRREPN
jgi:hypothetical protein